MARDGNDSTTIDGSDGSTFEFDQGDRIQTDELRIPRIKNRGDANAVEAEAAGKLMKLGHEKAASITIPTPQEVNAASRKGDFQESQQDYSQSHMEISRLSSALEVLTAKAIKISAGGGSIPLQLANEITVKKNTIDFQMDRLRATTEEPATTMAKADSELLRSIYETDFSAAVRRTMRLHGVNKATGIELTNQLIAATSEAEVLPQYARVAARMATKYPQSA